MNEVKMADGMRLPSVQLTFLHSLPLVLAWFQQMMRDHERWLCAERDLGPHSESTLLDADRGVVC